MSPVTRTLSRLVACWLLLTAAGCATLNLAHIDLRSRKATANNPVVKVVCIWEPAEGIDPKGVPCQGFAGQILFLNSTSLPVSVDGDVKVYLFDDKGPPEKQAEPLHAFNFDGPSWAPHYTYGTLGPAYSVFIPYMRRDVSHATCALRVRFTPKYGPKNPVFSDMASIQLVGMQTGASRATTTNSDSRVEEITPEDLTSTNKLRRTTTIVLNAQKGVASDSADPSSGSAGKNQVQQAGYAADDEVRPLTSDDARAVQLEQMVQELRALQGKKANSYKESSAKESPSPSTPPLRLDDESDEDHSRIRMRATKGLIEEHNSDAQDSQEPAGATGNPPDKSKVSAKVSDRSKMESQLAAGQSPRHPLDDSPAPVARNWTKKHPLDDASVPSLSVPSLSAGNPTADRNQPSYRRHPLDDEHPLEESNAPKTGRTNRVPSQVEQDRWRSLDPFDPIDTNAIETTAVEENRTIRRQLQTANQ